MKKRAIETALGASVRVELLQDDAGMSVLDLDIHAVTKRAADAALGTFDINALAINFDFDASGKRDRSFTNTGLFEFSFHIPCS
jgi:hypothetical protein